MTEQLTAPERNLRWQIRRLEDLAGGLEARAHQLRVRAHPLKRRVGLLALYAAGFHVEVVGDPYPPDHAVILCSGTTKRGRSCRNEWAALNVFCPIGCGENSGTYPPRGSPWYCKVHRA